MNRNCPHYGDTEGPEEETDDSIINPFLHKISRAVNKNKADVERGGAALAKGLGTGLPGDVTREQRRAGRKGR